MAQAWVPKTQEEANRRAAGRRKLHIRLRMARAERIRELLSDVLGGDAELVRLLRDGGYGATLRVAESFDVSPATASRDLALCRRMIQEFESLFGREPEPGRDEVVWTWDYSAYGWRAGSDAAASRMSNALSLLEAWKSKPRRGRKARRQPVMGSFPFTTRGT